MKEMRIRVIKGSWLLGALLVLMIVAGAAVGVGAAKAVFRVGSRDLPIYNVQREDQKIALTFDCAWNDEDVDSILESLDQYQCKAVFFMVGTWAEKYPESVRKIHERGHEIGSHSYNHGDYTKMSEEKIKEDMEKCDQIISGITGEQPKYFRAPSGGYNNTVVQTAEKTGRVYIQWSVDALDYPEDATPDSIYRRATEKINSGDIILMHNGTKYTAKVLPRILENLTRRFELSSLSELLYDDYVLDSAGMMIKK